MHTLKQGTTVETPYPRNQVQTPSPIILCPYCKATINGRSLSMEQCSGSSDFQNPCEHQQACSEFSSRGHRILPSGSFPSELECQEYGWFVSPDLITGLVPCHPRKTGARSDFSRLEIEAVWHPNKQRYVRSTRNPRTRPLTWAHLAKAFDHLFDYKILTKQDYFCCCLCGDQAMKAFIEGSLEQGFYHRGYAYYHELSANEVLKGRDLFIRFGAINTKYTRAVRRASRKVGKLVCLSLDKFGIPNEPIFRERIIHVSGDFLRGSS